jgi:hypothetical protein
MATWQFDVYLVPRSKLETVLGEIPERISPAQFDSTTWWDDAALPPGYTQLLSSFLSEQRSWSTELRTWGAEDGNRIDVGYTGTALSDVRVRFDLRHVDIGFVEAVVRLAQKADCWLVTEELEAIPPLTEKLFTEVMNSSARRFTVDPK